MPARFDEITSYRDQRRDRSRARGTLRLLRRAARRLRRLASRDARRVARSHRAEWSWQILAAAGSGWTRRTPRYGQGWSERGPADATPSLPAGGVLAATPGAPADDDRR